MDLWIRSQDRKNLDKVEDLEVYAGGNKSNNHFFIKSCGNYLGEYETEKRALEVLDEIQKYIGDNFNQEEVSQFLGLNAKNRMIYEMPKE